MTLAVAQRRSNGADLITSAAQIAKRALLKYMRTPQMLVLGTVQGGVFLLIFRYVFGGAISTPGVDYVNFVVPGFITTGAMFTAMYAALGMAEDMQAGFLTRLKSLPIPRSAALIGRAIADTGIQTWGLAVMVALGFLVGFRIHGSWASAIEAGALIVLYGFVFEWLFVLLGLLAKTPQAAQGFALIVFPFTFISSAYVPVATMPSWLQGFAANQPITMMIDTVRTLTEGSSAEALLGHPAAYFVVRSLIWCAGLLAVFVPLAVAKYQRTT